MDKAVEVRRLQRLMVAACLAVLAPLPAWAAEPGLAELRRNCPTTRNLSDSEFADPQAPNAARLDEWQSKIRGPMKVEAAPATAQIVIRAFAGSSHTQRDPSETATLLWRMPDGTWHFVSIDHYVGRSAPPPRPEGTVTAVEGPRAMRSGRVDGDQSKRLDRLMADPCLEAEPPMISSTVAVRGGVVPPPPCFDGTDQVAEINRGARRSVFVHYCPKLLSGELINIAVSPLTEGRRPSSETSSTIATPEEARLRGDDMITYYRSGQTWRNVTTTRTTELVHRPSGFRCAFDWDPSASVFGTPEWDAPSLSGNCYMRWGRVQTRTIVRRPLPGKDLKYVMMDAGPQEVGEAWRAKPSLYAISQVKLDGSRVSRAFLTDLPRMDAREEEHSILLGRVIDGWIVVQRTSGPATFEELDEVARREWRKLIKTRARSPTRPSPPPHSPPGRPAPQA
jgi:hypothetical protein